MSKFLRNPHAVLTLEQEQGVVAAIKVRAPIRNDRLRETIINRADEPELFTELLMQQIADAVGRTPELPVPLQTRFIELGLLIQEDQIAYPVSFHCDLTNDIRQLMPQRPDTPLLADQPADLIINPALQYLGTTESVKEQAILKNCAQSLKKGRHWYLVCWPELYAPRLYSLDTAQQEQLSAIKSGEKTPADLDSEWREILIAADILGTHESFEKTALLAEQKIATAHNELHNNRYTVIRHFIHPLQLAALRRYYRDLIENGHLRFGDAEWPLRFFAVNNPIARFYHDQIQALIEKITGEAVRATFTYLASYRPGAVLPPHRDREECEYAISLLLDYLPEPQDLSNWPIYVEEPGRPGIGVPVLLGIGDLLLYFGRELIHYRYAFQEGEASTTYLFFYQPTRLSTAAQLATERSREQV